MTSSELHCPGCNADLGTRRHCLSCDTDLLPAPEESTGWLAHLRGTVTRVDTEGEEIAGLQLEVAGGNEVEVQLSTQAQWLPECTEMTEGDAVELLVAQLLIFEEGGLREAPRRRQKLVARVITTGDEAGALMQRVVDERRGSEDEDHRGAPEAPWPEGFRIDPRPGKGGWRLRLHLSPPRWDFTSLLPLVILCGFFGYYFWVFSPSSRPVVMGVIIALLHLVGFARLLRYRTIVLDAEKLSVQRGPLPWPRRRVAATSEVAAVYTSKDDSGYAVEVLDRAGGREQVIWDQSDGLVALLMARALQKALGLEERAPVDGEALPAVSGRLPDLERMLRPLHRKPGCPPAVAVGRAKVADKEEAPRAVRVRRDGDQLSLRVSCSSVGSWPLYLAVPFVILLLRNHSQLFSQGMPWPILDGATLAGALICGYSVLTMVINHTRLEVSSTALRASRAPLPWPGTGALNHTMISHLETESHLVGKGTWTYSLHLITRDGRRQALLKQAPRATVEWVEDALNAELGLG